MGQARRGAAQGSGARARQPVTLPGSIPGVLDVLVVRGDRAARDAAPDLLVEVPHGATRTTDFTALAAKLRRPLRDRLVVFSPVTPDAGAYELGEAVARRFVAAAPTRACAILRCRTPRTFIDCNRRIDAAPEE